MYPGPADPDLGVFVRGMEEALAARGHILERAVLDHRGGGKRKYLTLSAATLQTTIPPTTILPQAPTPVRSPSSRPAIK